MDELSCDDTGNDCEETEDMLDFFASLLDHVLRTNHQFKQKTGLFVVVLAAIENAKQRQFVEIIHILGILFEKLHSEAAMQH